VALELIVPSKGDLHSRADSTGLRTPLMQAIREFAANAPRSLQKAVGPSQVGTPCARQLAFQLSDLPPTRDLNDPWPSIVGTAVHAWLADAMTHANNVAGELIWMTERRVDAGWGMRGSCDIFHVPSGTVLDWKILGDTQYAKYTNDQPSEGYKTQAHTYGLGFANLGFEVNTVGIVFLGRAKMLKDMHIWSEPFDKLRALKAIRRFVKLQSIMAARVDGVPTDPMRIAAIPGGQCFFCNFKSATPDGSDGYCCEKVKKGK
jgi:hypothetical protein